MLIDKTQNMKTKFIITSIFTIFISYFGLLSFQTSEGKISDDYQDTILFENNQIKFQTKFVEYKEPNRSVIKNYVIYTVTNKTNKKLEVKFSKEAFYNEKCSSCGSLESQYTIILNKKEVLMGDCSNRKDRALKVFHSFKTNESNSVLTDLRLTNIIISKL